jgi:uncharacterized membrane protein YagU involved in acid resistance
MAAPQEEEQMITHPTFVRAALGGFVGTLVMTAMIYFVAPMVGLRMDIAAMLGSMLGGSWIAGMVMHFVNGSVIFPAIYVYALYAHLPGSPAVRGTVWGVALWLLAQTVVMPMMGAGLFSSAMGGMMAAMGSLIGHVLYGSLLGIIASAPELRVAHA